jgi:Zn-dependent protease/CBS domain-containing protein
MAAPVEERSNRRARPPEAKGDQRDLLGDIRLLRVFGIPINVNISWFLTLLFVTTLLALRFFPAIIPETSPHRDNTTLHWAMAIFSGIVFFASILLHELAHSIIAKAQGIPVKGITLFIFGGVAQIAGDPKRPRNEFLMAVVGPLTSIALGGVFFLLWWTVGGQSSTRPLSIVLQWLFVMNVVVGIFNLLPAFPMDGGRVLRSALWGLTGNYSGSTRWSGNIGRAAGYAMMLIGALAAFHFIGFLDPWSGLWFFVLGLFLESSARKSLVQARALSVLGEYRAEDIMSRELPTVPRDTGVRFLMPRGPRRHFIFFVAGDQDEVLGVLTEKEVEGLGSERRLHATAGEVMLRPEEAITTSPSTNGADMLMAMEAAEVWHLPVVSEESRLVGVVSKESLLRVIAGRVLRRPAPASQT